MKRLHLASALAATALAVTALGACGSSDDSTSSGSTKSDSASASASASSSPSASASKSASKAAQPQTAMISIKDYKYSGASSVKPGTKIMIKNSDTEAHTVTADTGGAFDVNIAPGKTAMLTAPAKAGTYKYHCTYHGNMHGTLTVG